MFTLIPSLYFWSRFLYNHFFPRTKNVLGPLIINPHFKRDPMDVEHDLKFDPPVYRLRYAFVQDTLLEETSRINIRKVVEFGCAEMKLLPYMKRLFTLRTILLVDIDKELLNENLFRIRPMTFDYLFKRSDSLEVSVYAGSISDPDCSLVDTDVVIGIELIEHLYPDVLEALPHNIFGYMQPHLVILTTPNADFNVLFKNFKGMRHFDHKFEWTRQQFNDWATNITERYPNYNVTFAGVGNPPEQCEGYGFCSQIAIFRRMEVPNRNEVPFDYHRTNEKMLHDDFDISFGICTYCSYKAQIDMYESYGSIEERIPNDHSEASNIYYQLLDKMDYPYEKDDRTNAEKNLDEIKYNMHKLGHINGIYFNDDRDRSEIPLYQVIKDYHGNFVTESEARSILIKHGYAVQDCLVNGFEESCVIYEPIMNSSNISPLSGTTDDDTFALDEEEDWDTYYNTENYKNPSDKMVNTDADTDANNKEITARKSTLKSSQQQQQKTNKTVAIDEAASKLKLENDSRTYDDLNEVYPLAGTSASFSSANSSQHSRKKRKKRNDYEEEAMRPVEVIANDLIDGALDSLDKNETSCANSQSNTESNSPSFSSSVTTSVTQTDDSRSQNDSDRTVPERELAHASREVLYDSNSEVSMLEDFDMAMERWEDVASEQNVSQPQLVLLGINVNNNNEDDVLRLPPNSNPFPNWLLQLLGANAMETGTDSHDEPHFYCQGDGLGVHPSIVEVDLEEEEDTSSDSSMEEAGNNAEDNSSAMDVPAIPEDLVDVVPTNSLGLIGFALGRQVSESSVPEMAGNDYDSGDEFFDTIDEPENKAHPPN